MMLIKVYFVAIIDRNIEKRAIFFSILFESGKSDSGAQIKQIQYQ